MYNNIVVGDTLLITFSKSSNNSNYIIYSLILWWVQWSVFFKRQMIIVNCLLELKYGRTVSALAQIRIRFRFYHFNLLSFKKTHYQNWFFFPRIWFFKTAERSMICISKVHPYFFTFISPVTNFFNWKLKTTFSFYEK